MKSIPLLLLCLLPRPDLLACPGSSWGSPEDLPEEYVRASALTPDGTLIAAGHPKGRVELIATSDGEHLLDLEPKLSDDARELAFSPSGDRLALSTREGSWIHVIDVETREQLWRSGYLGGHFSEVMQLCWSPDGSRLWFAFACGGGHLYCVEPKSEAEPIAFIHAEVPRFAETIGVITLWFGVGTVTPDGRSKLIAWRWKELEESVYSSALLTIRFASSWIRFR